jgi:hypothetical protein
MEWVAANRIIDVREPPRSLLMRFAQLTASYAISTLMRIVMARWVHLPLAAVDISDDGINKASSAMI